MTDAKLTQLEQRALACPEQAKTYIVKDEPTLLRANDFIHGVKALIKEIKDFFKPMKDKAKQAHQAVVDAEKKLLNPLYEGEAIVKPQIGGYLAEQRRLQLEAEEKAREIARQAENPFDDTVPEQQAVVPIPKPIKLKGTGIREDWKWELEDFDKVPRELLCLDAVKINALVRAGKEKAITPMKKQGIRVFKVDTVVSGYGQ